LIVHVININAAVRKNILIVMQPSCAGRRRDGKRPKRRRQQNDERIKRTAPVDRDIANLRLLLRKRATVRAEVAADMFSIKRFPQAKLSNVICQNPR
jgi:hypothetical protein